MVFDCFFENDIAKLTVNGNVISGADAQGNELFRHAYAFVQDAAVTFFGQEMPAQMHIYKTEDAERAEISGQGQSTGGNPAGS